METIIIKETGKIHTTVYTYILSLIEATFPNRPKSECKNITHTVFLLSASYSMAIKAVEKNAQKVLGKSIEQILEEKGFPRVVIE